MGEMMNKTEATAAARRLHWTAADLTEREASSGHTAYVAEADGVKFRIVGVLVTGRMDGARKFRAYRVVGQTGHSLRSVREGGALRLLKSAKEECELDLADVIARREIDEAAEWQATPAYRRFARATQLAGGYRGALDLLHAEAGAEHRARFGPAIGEFAGSHAFRPGRADARHCDFADCGARAESPNHNGWAPREIEFPTPVCPDAEAGKPHAAHRIAGTWRDDCPGVRHVGRSCCPSTEGDVHDRSCKTDEARAQWAPRAARSVVHVEGASAPIREALDRVSVAAYEAVEAAIEAATSTPQADPATDDDVTELVDRIVRRAQYVALGAVLAQVDRWLAKAGDTVDPVVLARGEVAADSFRGMVNDAATDLGVPRPYAGRRPSPQFEPGDRVYPRSGGEVYTVERVAVIQGSAGRQQFWAVGNAIPQHSDGYQLVKPKP
jgi:hypothetical protein